MQQNDPVILEMETALALLSEPSAKIQWLTDSAVNSVQEAPRKSRIYAAELLRLGEELGDRYTIGRGMFYCGRAHLIATEPETALSFFEQGEHIYSEIGHQYELFRCRYHIAACYRLMSRYAKGLEVAQQCLSYAIEYGSADDLATTYIHLGSLYCCENNFVEAIKSVNLALSYCEHGDGEDHGKNYILCYDLLSIAYGRMDEEAELSFFYNQKYIDASIENGYKRGEANGMTNMAVWYAFHGERQKALECLHHAQNVENTEHLLPFFVRRWIEAYEHLDEHEQAIEWYEKAKAVLDSAGLKSEIVFVYHYLATGYTHRGEYDHAIELFHKGLELAPHENNIQSYYQLLGGISVAYEQSGNFQKSLEYYKLYLDVYKTLISEEKQKAITEMQTKFDVESTEREKELFRVKNVELSAALDEVRRLNDNLTKLNTEKNEVLGIVAHDLKSPLSGVRMVASLLKEHYKRMPEVELETQLETIVDSTERMLSISSNLLKAQHIESGNAYGGAARVDVSAVVGGLVESYRATAASKGITIAFECEQSVELVCSEEALRQSVENLLSNAVKFTVHNGRVQVRLKRTVKSAVVEVQDEGPGISKSDKRKLYGKYARLSARPTGGESTTGLGLWIAKRAVESLRGTIRCISGESGTIFKIEVPMATIN